MSRFRQTKWKGAGRASDGDCGCLNCGDLKPALLSGGLGGYSVHLLSWSGHFLADNLIFLAAQMLPETFSIKLLRMEVAWPLQRLISICSGAEDRQLCNPASCIYPSSSWPDRLQQAAGIDAADAAHLILILIWWYCTSQRIWVGNKMNSGTNFSSWHLAQRHSPNAYHG